MSYEVLARKWRPQTFDEVIGQDHITRTLKRAVESSRLSHAYLFSGPRGCGKTSTARILAKVINCTQLDRGNPCNECDSCTAVIRGNNLDAMEIDGASHTGVAEVRDLQESIGYAPSQFSSKVYIIDEVHMLSTHAFNALLKTLEEPPSHVYFIFATTAPHKIPDTIKSRCQRHQFKRLEVAEIASQLELICTAEKVTFEPEALRLLGRKAEGSMRDGESLLDQVITASSGDVKTKSVRQILGLLDQEMIGRFLGAMGARDATEVLKQLDAAVREGVDLEELVNALIEGFRDLMLLSTPGDLSDLIFRSQEEVVALREFLGSYELGDLVTIVERMCNVVPRLKMASDPRILMESVLVDLTLIDRQIDIRDLITSLEGSGTKGGGGRPASRGAAKSPRKPESGKTASPAARTRFQGDADRAAFVRPRDESAEGQTPAPAAAAGWQDATPAEDQPDTQATIAVSAKDVDLSSLGYADLRKLWDGFVTHVRQKKVALGVCLISGTLKSFDENQILIRFAKGFSFQRDQVESPSSRKFLKGMLTKYFGRDIELVCVSEGEEASGRVGAADRGAETSPAKRPIETKPIVKKILTAFDGEIIRYHPQ
jgi:DNA polymerase-3 subunit gamma/tau